MCYPYLCPEPPIGGSTLACLWRNLCGETRSDANRSRDQQLDWVPAALVAHWLRTPELEVLTAAENCSFGRKRPTDSVPVHEFGDPKTVVK